MDLCGARALCPGVRGSPLGLGAGDGAPLCCARKWRPVSLRGPFSLSLPRAGFFPFSFSFFSFLERSPAPGVWNQLDKLLSYGGGRGGSGRAARGGGRGRGEAGGGGRAAAAWGWGAHPHPGTLPGFGASAGRGAGGGGRAGRGSRRPGGGGESSPGNGERPGWRNEPALGLQ